MGGVLAAGAAGECQAGRWGRSPWGCLSPVPALSRPGFQACDAWQREAKEAKERALAADSARQLALQKKEEVEAQFRRLQEELEGRGVSSTLPGLRSCGDIGAIPLPKLHSLQSQLRLDLEAVDGVSPGFGFQGTQGLSLATELGTEGGGVPVQHCIPVLSLVPTLPQLPGHMARGALPPDCASPLCRQLGPCPSSWVGHICPSPALPSASCALCGQGGRPSRPTHLEPWCTVGLFATLQGHWLLSRCPHSSSFLAWPKAGCPRLS